MTWFVESPWPSVALGVTLEIIFGILLVRTGRAVVFAPMAIVLALTVAMVVIERAVVTETEEVENALDAVAHALAANDVEAVLAAFSPQCPRLGEVRSALARFTVSDARVGGDLEVRFNRLTSPPSATTYFTGRVAGKDKRGAVPYENMIRKFKVTFHRDGRRWLIADYSDADFRDRREP